MNVKGQASLIASTIMIGVTLVVGIATLAYFNTTMATQSETLAIQKAVYDASSSLVISLIVRENDTAVFFLTSRATSHYGIAVVGVREPLRFVYLSPGTDYDIYVSTATDVDVIGASGWTALTPAVVSGTNIIYDISTLANLPVPAGVARVSISSPNYPVTIRVDLSLTKQVDFVRIYVLTQVNNKWYAINHYDLPIT